MILSFHPLVAADRQILCAGREPNNTDLTAIRQADAVILPQGCSQRLYEMARAHVPHVFPNYDSRFAYPGKIGQAALFESVKAPHPRTVTFTGATALQDSSGGYRLPDDLTFPVVLKYNWGGEGDAVFKVARPADLNRLLSAAGRTVPADQRGFLLQSFVPHGDRSLRVVVIGRTVRSYWRVQGGSSEFGAGVSRGAVIDHDTDPPLQEKGVQQVRSLCRRTGINLAGFDLIFPEANEDTPLFLEINYFFGRRGLGGAENYYRLLLKEIDRWVSSLPV